MPQPNVENGTKKIQHFVFTAKFEKTMSYCDVYSTQEC